MKASILICVSLLVWASLLLGTVQAVEVVLQDGASDALEVHVVESDGARTVLEYQLGSFSHSPVDIGGEQYNLISLAEESQIVRAGFPDLPNICRSIIIPGDAEMGVEVISASYVEFPGIPVAPSKGVIMRDTDPATVPYVFDPIYETKGWCPDDIAYGLDPYIIRDFRGMVVVVNPFQYDPATRVLRVYYHIVVEVEPVGFGGANVLGEPPAEVMNEEFRRIYERHFLNFDAVEPDRYAAIGEIGSMLVIAHGDFMADMVPFVEWKKQMGVPCEMVSVTAAGGDSTGIKDYIQDYYDDEGVVFVLLVGDAAEVPTCKGNGGSSDHRYALTAGGDLYPDLFVGRFSAETVAHVQTQVVRSVEYERDPQAAANWYHRGTGIASDQGPGDDGEMDDEHMGFIRDDLLAFTYSAVDEIYDPTATAGDVTTAVNAGRSIINYVGHGGITGWSTTGFSNTHVNALTNDNELPFVFSVACLVGRFDGNTCFAEAWLRATNGGEPSGAAAAYMSTISQPWSEPMDAQDEMNDLLVGDLMRTFGALSFNGSCHMLDEYPGEGGRKTMRTWTVFGDPSLRVRTDTPAGITVNHEDDMEPYATSFDVEVVGVEDALCALYYDGTLFGSVFTDATGNVTIPISGDLPWGTNILLTVTGFNKMTYIAEVYVRFPEFCSFSQGFYGNHGGGFNGDPTIDVIDGVITGADPLVLGMCGRTLTFGEGSEECVIERLPGGGPPQALPEGLGNATIDAGTCQTSPVEIPLNNGRIRNILLAQTITLSLNTRLGGSGDNLDLCCRMIVQDADCGPNGICGDSDDVPDPGGTISTIVIGDGVLGALTDLGLDWNVGGLLTLANRALGGVSTGGVSLSEINEVVTTINEAFHGCRFLIDCTDCPPGSKGLTTPLVGGPEGDAPAKQGIPARFALAGNTPNPVRSGTTIRYALPEISTVRLVVYNLRGQVVAVLEDGTVGAGYRAAHWDAAVSCGVYFYRFEAIGIESAKSFRRTGKLVVMR